MTKRLTFAVIFLLAWTNVEGHSGHALGSEEVQWRADNSIRRVITMFFDWQRGNPYVAWKPAGRAEKREGRNCLVGPMFFFDVDDDFAFDITESVQLELTFDTTLSNGFSIAYDHAVEWAVKEVEFARNTNDRWHKEVLTLPNARFANRGLEGTDFTLSARGNRFPVGKELEIALCDLKIVRASPSPIRPDTGTISIQIADEKGIPSAARVGLYDRNGVLPLPGDQALTLLRFADRVKQLPMWFIPQKWSENGRYAFIVNETYRSEVPVGDYELFVMKGPEYRIETRAISVKPNVVQEIKVNLSRWIDLPQREWYSGDDHIHISRPSNADDSTILAFMKAEDLHVANLLEMGNLGASYFQQYAFGELGHYVGDTYSLVSGQESPRTTHLGHTIGLNAKAFYWPDPEYFLYDRTADAVHADGGYWGYAHVALDSDVIRVDWGLALDIALGKVDFIEMLQSGVLNTKYLYDFLNLGFKVLPSAGSDYPYIRFAGADRLYIKVNGKLSPQNWFSSWKANRSFVSTWPVIEFAVNGDRDSSEFPINGGDTVEIVATASVNPDLDVLERLELVSHGKVIASELNGSMKDSITLRHKFHPDRSQWLALRTIGTHGAIAHTSPIFVYVDGDRRFWMREEVQELAMRYKKSLHELKTSRPQLQIERFSTEGKMIPKWLATKSALDMRIDEANKVYDQLIERAKRKD